MAKIAKIGIDGKVTLIDEELPLTPISVLIPQVVSRRQARRALLQAGLLNQVDAIIDGVADEMTREQMRIDWQDATEFKRDDLTLNSLAVALNLNSAQLDNLFIQASQY